MEDLLNDVGGWWAAFIAVVAGVLTWLGARLAWWKQQTKPVRIAVAVGGFLLIAFTLSLITAPFT